MEGFKLEEMLADLGGMLRGDADLRVKGIGPLATADANTVSFLAHAKYKSQLNDTQAGAVLVTADVADQVPPHCRAWIVADPYHHFARLTQWWAARIKPAVEPRIHPSAVIDPLAEVGDKVDVGPMVVVAAGARIGHGVTLGAHCVIEEGAHVGDGSQLSARVTVGRQCMVGQRARIHSGAVIGSDGFGFAMHQGRWEKIEQLGRVRIGDDVEIGANTCIDRGALDDTVIGHGVKLDNLVQIGHNVQIGEHTAMAGCAGVAGSARIGAGCTIGGGAIVLGHLSLADGVHVSAASVVMRSLSAPGQYTGVFPIDDNRSWEKNAATLRSLHALRQRLVAVEKGLALISSSRNSNTHDHGQTTDIDGHPSDH